MYVLLLYITYAEGNILTTYHSFFTKELIQLKFTQYLYIMKKQRHFFKQYTIETLISKTYSVSQSRQKDYFVKKISIYNINIINTSLQRSLLQKLKHNYTNNYHLGLHKSNFNIDLLALRTRFPFEYQSFNQEFDQIGSHDSEQDHIQEMYTHTVTEVILQISWKKSQISK